MALLIITLWWQCYLFVIVSFLFTSIKGWPLKIFVVTSPRLRCVIWWTLQDSRFLNDGISLSTTTSGNLVYQQADALQTKTLFFRTRRYIFNSSQWYKKQQRLTIPINTLNGYLCDLTKEFLIFPRRKDKTLCRQRVLEKPISLNLSCDFFSLPGQPNQ